MGDAPPHQDSAHEHDDRADGDDLAQEGDAEGGPDLLGTMPVYEESSARLESSARAPVADEERGPCREEVDVEGPAPGGRRSRF